MKTIVSLPGQGIGPKVVDATCELLMGTGLSLKILTPPQGNPLPEETKRAAREAGGLGLAPSGNFGDGWAYFESVHGSAPGIAGKGIANPTATIRSPALMLEHMGMGAEAQRLDAAVGRVYRNGKTLTPDQGGRAKTREMVQAVLAAYR